MSSSHRSRKTEFISQIKGSGGGVALRYVKLAQGQFHPFRWRILGEIKRKEEKRKNGKENKKQTFRLLFLQKQRFGC
jgi:hypothetical protein